MTHEDFNHVLKQGIDKVATSLITKSKEYSSDEDKLANFKDAASFKHEGAKLALWGMVTKHIIALNTFIERDEKGIEVPDEQWDEKIFDIINYLFLLKGLLVEEKKND